MRGAQGARGGGLPDAERVTRVLEPVVRASGMDLESVRIGTAGRRRLLRIVVDADGGVALDDIALISRNLSAALDSGDVMGEQPYTLEVSSPGVDRPLTEPRHWRRASGRLVTVPLAAGGAGAAAGSLHGRIVAAGDAGVTLDVEGVHRQLGYAEIGAGRVQVEFGRADAEGAGPAGPAPGGPASRHEGEPDGH